MMNVPEPFVFTAPLARWEYGHAAEPGSAEARLADYLRPRDWLSESGDDAPSK